jgi:DNA-binding response OmpR family regulator
MANEVDAHIVAIIEYEERLAGLLTQFFQIRGFSIGFVAYNEKDAMLLLFNSEVLPGIIILDHRKDVMNGIRVMKEIHGLLPDINIIFLSPDQYAEEEAISMGAAIFLKKPVNIIDLDRALEQILSRYTQ